MKIHTTVINGVRQHELEFRISLNRVAYYCEYILGYTLLALAVGTLAYVFFTNGDVL